MNEYEKRQRLDLILRHLADEIDVSPTRYQEAKDHYNAVGEWLGRDDSELAPFLPVVFPQGSFVLGTAIRPIGDEEYDVDTVCRHCQLGVNSALLRLEVVRPRSFSRHTSPRPIQRTHGCGAGGGEPTAGGVD